MQSGNMVLDFEGKILESNLDPSISTLVLKLLENTNLLISKLEGEPNFLKLSIDFVDRPSLLVTISNNKIYVQVGTPSN